MHGRRNPYPFLKRPPLRDHHAIVLADSTGNTAGFKAVPNTLFGRRPRQHAAAANGATPLPWSRTRYRSTPAFARAPCDRTLTGSARPLHLNGGVWYLQNARHDGALREVFRRFDEHAAATLVHARNGSLFDQQVLNEQASELVHSHSGGTLGAILRAAIADGPCASG